jgi:hypothetical protein
VIPYTLGTGQSTGPITGSPNRPIFIIGTNTTPGDQGTGFISLVHGDGTGPTWLGQDNVPNIVARPKDVPPEIPIFLDPQDNVQVLPAGATAVMVQNNGPRTQTGFLFILEPPQ